MAAKLTLGSGLVCAAASLVCAFLAREPPAGSGQTEPLLVASEPAKHLGKVKQGKTIDVRFQLENRYHEPLTILEVRKSCTCVDATVSRSLLQPGESTAMDIRWNSGASRGSVAAEIFVTYKRPEYARECTLGEHPGRGPSRLSIRAGSACV